MNSVPSNSRPPRFSPFRVVTESIVRSLRESVPHRTGRPVPALIWQQLSFAESGVLFHERARHGCADELAGGDRWDVAAVEASSRPALPAERTSRRAARRIVPRLIVTGVNAAG